MKYRRDEAFRFAFGEPIDALFQITKLDDKPVTTAHGKAQILDISPEGLRICSELNIPDITTKTITLMISFQINEVPFNIEGKIVWKRILGNLWSYGIKLHLDYALKTEIINQLKIYSKTQAKK